MQEACDFLKKCKIYYLATMDGDQPRVRPFGTANMFEGKLYFQTGKTKLVAGQIRKNPKIEITAFDGTSWIRIEAIAVEDDRRECRQAMLDAYPALKENFSADDGDTQVYYLKKATTTMSKFLSTPKAT
ncbi:MAG: pyridoxamine 5'-phosphate oxidase family protein [Spirochaetaceae bacterium]|nr:pyridoxamine 5'-phosphate oxidase family protein [Spirochaetaceae bacterium]